MGDTLAISRSLLDEIRASAGSSDDEVCGLLLGPARHDGDHTVTSIQPCRNVAANPARHFEIDPAALIAAHRSARTNGRPILGHYHSHPSGDPIPSATDAAAASPDGWIWLIAAQGEVHAWRAVRDGAVHGRFDPVALIEPPACA